MKKITTLVNNATNKGDRAVTFTIPSMTIHHRLQNRMPKNGGTLDNNGIRTYVNDNIIIYVDDAAYQSTDKHTPVHIGVVVTPSSVELILRDMGLTQKPRVLTSVNELSLQLIQTYNDLGVYDWIHQEVPDGIRSMVAYQYGYTMDAAYNAAFNKAWSMADDYLRAKKAD